MTPVGTRLSRLTTLGSGGRLCTLLNSVRGGNVVTCGILCINTSRVGDDVGTMRACRAKLDVNRHRCCLRGSRTATGVHSTFHARMRGVCRLTNFSRTATGGNVRIIVSIRAHLTGTFHSHARLHSPRTGCGGVDVRRLGGGCPAFS